MGLAGGDGDGVVGGADEKAAALVDAGGRAFQSSGAGGVLDAHRTTGEEGRALVAAQRRHEAELAPTTVVHEDAGDDLALDVGDDLLATSSLLALRQCRDGLGQ